MNRAKSKDDLISELENQIQALTAANQRLQQIDQQRAHFLSAVSHDLRTPFTPIRGYLDLLRDGALGPLNLQQQHAVNIINDNLQNALALLDDLLTLSKLQTQGITLSPESFSAQALLEEIICLYNTGQLKTNIAPDLPQIYGDREQLRQAILTLLNSAIRFNKEGPVALSAWKETGRLIISIQDKSLGLLPPEIPGIFDTFWQITEIEGFNIGTGLGLALSKHLVEAHQGRLCLENTHNEETRFLFEIPVNHE